MAARKTTVSKPAQPTEETPLKSEQPPASELVGSEQGDGGTPDTSDGHLTPPENEDPVAVLRMTSPSDAAPDDDQEPVQPPAQPDRTAKAGARPCRTCFSAGWPDGATAVGCEHGNWQRTPADGD
ncbi:hypothetical protein ABTZ78_17465 [Streptomyces bauhiniae]|uniref:hypothetical protein n=1 Tax=Streptomyces bauhiniae TaxID=2340725 RepID=UPI0033240192